MATVSKRGRFWLAQIVRRDDPPRYRTFDTCAEAACPPHDRQTWRLALAQRNRLEPPSMRSVRGIGLNKLLGNIHIDPTLAETKYCASRAWKCAPAPQASLAWVGRLHALGHAAEFRAVPPRAAQVGRLHGLPLIGPQCALLLAAERRWEDALRLAGHTRARYAAASMTMTDDEIAALAALEQQARAELGDSRAQVLLADGMALDDAAADTLVLTPPRLPAPSAMEADGRLPQGQASS